MSDQSENRIFYGLVEQLEGFEARDTVDFTQLDRLELLDRLAALDEFLIDRHELLTPTTRMGRDLHAEKAAITIVMNRRQPK